MTMGRKVVLAAVLASSLALCGCAASIAANAVGAAIQSATPRPQGADMNRVQAAAEACRLRAAEHGTVSIIDVEQRGGTLIVWGAVGEGAERRSFQCNYGKAITSFKLREIPKR